MGRLFNLDNPVMNALNKLADLIILNFLTMICCIPIFTIGASATALHYVALKIVRDEETYIIKGFFKSFRQNNDHVDHHVACVGCVNRRFCDNQQLGNCISFMDQGRIDCNWDFICFCDNACISDAG